MEDLIIENLAVCFKESKEPILIFCDWKDAVKIKLDIESKMLNGMHGNFTNTIRFPSLRYFSCMMEGKTFVFIDTLQMDLFLKLKNK
jgi:hypothetical protein